MTFKLFLCFVLISTIAIQTAQAQGWVRLMLKAANKADDATHAVRALTAAEKAVIASKAARWTKAPGWAIDAKKTAFWFTHQTDDVTNLDAFLLLENDKVVLRSNLRAHGSNVYTVSAPLGQKESNYIEVKQFVKKLISDDNGIVAGDVLENSYQNIRIKVDPAIFEKIAADNIDWGGRNGIYLFDGENTYLMKSVKNAEGKTEPMIELKNNVYKRIIPDGFCTAIGYAGVLYDATMFLTNANELEIVEKGIEIKMGASIIQPTSNMHTLGSFISVLTGAGYTVIDVTCQSEEMIEKYVYEIYKEPDASEQFLELAEKIGKVEVSVKSPQASELQPIDPKPGPDEDESMGLGWKIVIGIVVILVILGIIGSFSND